MVHLVSVCTIALSLTTIQGLPMSADYETGTINSGYPDIETHPPLPDRARVDRSLARNSSFAVVHQLYSTDPSIAGSKRCESDNMKMGDARVRAGEEVFYGFTFYIPSTWMFDDNYDDILVQWKGFGGGPFMFITQKHEGLFLRINANTDPDYDPENGDEDMVKYPDYGLDTTDSDMIKYYDYDPEIVDEDAEDMIKSQHVITDKLERGVWHDFRLQVIWDFTLVGFGFVAVDYKTSGGGEYERAVSVIGPNMYNREGYLKWGIYKPAWQAGGEFNVTLRKVWHDNVRIGSSWELVDPTY